MSTALHGGHQQLQRGMYHKYLLSTSRHVLLSAQLALIDADIFNEIRYTELLKQAWSKTDKDRLVPPRCPAVLRPIACRVSQPLFGLACLDAMPLQCSAACDAMQAGNVLRFTARFNEVSAWVVSLIVTEKNLETRAKVEP